MIGLLIGLFSIPAVADSLPLAEDPPIFPLKDIERGQRGYGYTVFASADGPERFEFEVLGVMHGFLGPGEDLIIARLIGDKIERTRVISGMSGSPTYIDDKLVGAVGYRLGAFTHDAIAGITPIERMLASGQGAPAGRFGAPRSSSTTKGSGTTATASPYGHVEPISTPVVTSGLHPAVLTHFAEELDKRGYGPFVPAAGASTSTTKSTGRARLVPAGPIAGLFVEGDIRMAGIGTVTWVKGDRFLAFGHPFLSIGETRMPVYDAEIVTTVSSDAGSWKMGQATLPAGRLTDDRLHAIVGEMGPLPDMVDVDIHLDDDAVRAEQDSKHDFHVRVMHHPTDTPLFIGMVLAQATTTRIGSEFGGTVDIEGEVWFEDGQHTDLAYRSAMPVGYSAMPAVIAAWFDLAGITQHGFEQVALERVRFNVKRRSAVDYWQLDGLSAERMTAGREATVRYRLKGFETEAKDETTTVSLPRSLPAGTYTLVVASPKKARRIERDAGIHPTPKRHADVIAARRHRPRPGEVSIYLLRDRPTASVAGSRSVALPSTLDGILDGSGGWLHKKTASGATLLARIPSDVVIDGEVRTKIVVRAADGLGTHVD